MSQHPAWILDVSVPCCDTIAVVNAPSTSKALVDHQWITSRWIVQATEILLKVMPGQVAMAPLGKAFYDNDVYLGDCAGAGRDVFLALMCFMMLSAFAQRKELSTKS